MHFRSRIKPWDCVCRRNKKKAGWEDGWYTFCLLHRPGHPPSSLPQNAHDREDSAADFFHPAYSSSSACLLPPFYFQMTSLHVSSSSSSSKGMTCLGMCVNLYVCVYMPAFSPFPPPPLPDSGTQPARHPSSPQS